MKKMEMRRYMIGIFIVLLCIDVALGVWAFHNRSAFGSMPSSERMDAMRTMDLSSFRCRYVIPKNSKDMCFSVLAEQETNASYCSDISDTDTRESCYFDIYGGMGDLLRKTIEIAANGSASLQCQQQGVCEAYIALISGEGDMAGVIRKLADPDAMCSAIANRSYRDLCFSDIAGALNDPDFCGHIEGAATKDACFLTLSGNDSGQCGQILNESVREDCYEKAFQRGDYSVCASISNSSEKERCEILSQVYATYGVKLNLLAPDERLDAIGRIAANSSETAQMVCERVYSDDGCYYAVAEATDDSGDCMLIGNQAVSDLCLIRIATRTNDTSICSMVSAKRQDMCRLEVV